MHIDLKAYKKSPSNLKSIHSPLEQNAVRFRNHKIHNQLGFPNKDLLPYFHLFLALLHILQHPTYFVRETLFEIKIVINNMRKTS